MKRGDEDEDEENIVPQQVTETQTTPEE